MGRSRLRSLRYRALLVVVAVVVSPLVWVWLAGTFETVSSLRTRSALRDAALEVAGAVEAGADPEPIAARRTVRARVVDARGAVSVDLDHAEPVRLFEPVSDPFFGPEGAPDLRAYDLTLPALAERAESVAAAASPGEAVARCDVMDRGLLLVCAAAVRTPSGALVHVVGAR